MAGSLNKVCLLGNVGKDPEIRNTQSGMKIVNLTLATEESWTDKQSGERKSKTEWHKISVFNQGLVGVIEKYVKKGSKLYIEGQLQTRKWQAQDGTDRYSTEVTLGAYGGQLILLNRPGDQSSAPREAERPAAQRQSAAPSWDAPRGGDLDDEIPF